MVQSARSIDSIQTDRWKLRERDVIAKEMILLEENRSDDIARTTSARGDNADDVVRWRPLPF